MIAQLALGTVVIIATVTVKAAFIAVAMAIAHKIRPWLARSPRLMRRFFALVAVTLWQLAALGVGAWIWTAAFLVLGAFDALEPALYFAVVCFTTLGFGDIILEEELRLLSGLCAANGLLLFGLSSAFLIEFILRLPRLDPARDPA